MAIRKPERGRYTVEFELNHVRVFRRLPRGATKAQADALELKERREIIDRDILGKPPALTIRSLVEKWRDEVGAHRKKSGGEQKSKIRLVLAALEELSLGKRPASDVQAVASELVEFWEGLAPGTINRRLCVLKAACKWAWKVKRWTPFNLSPFVVLLDGEASRSRVVDLATIGKIVRAMKTPEGKAFVALGAYALMRQGEVMRLDKPAIARGAVRILDWEDKIRTVAIVPQLRPHLKAVPLTRHVRTLYAEFEVARAALKLEDFVYHDLRRSGATILLNAGERLEIVSHILGHANLETTRKIYAHVLAPTVKRAMRKGFKPIKIPSGSRREARKSLN